jgi:predicted Zn-dependent protease
MVLITAFVAGATLPAQAASLIRDADIEHALGQLASPILKAAGLSPTRVRVLVIKDSSLNAFVVDSNHIFIHSGLILKTKTAAQLQAVIAHEAAHIANGHFTRRLGNMRTARTVTSLGILLAAAAAASGNTQAAGGIAAGVSGSALRNFLSHTRAEESAADRSGVAYMVSAGVSPQGAVEVLDLFRGQEALSASRQDPYARSHPLTQDRIRALKGFAAAYADQIGPNLTAEYWFLRAQGKLSAFTQNTNWTLRRANGSDDISIMRRAIAFHRQPDTAATRKAIDALVAARPNDAFYYELRGQILLESRQFNTAVKAYKRAVDLSPRNALILGGYGRALMANGQNKQALTALEKARARDSKDGRILRDLAAAYAAAGQTGMASVTTAERFALRGRLKDAAIHAKRASGLLPRGSTAWQRAQDILRSAEAANR